MHELGIAIEILRACRTELEAQGGGRLVSVTVAVGDLAAVEPDLLRYAWAGLTAEEDREETRDARLVVESVRAEQRCVQCGVVADRQPGTWLRLCPDCGRPLRVEGGTELELRELILEPLPVPTEIPS